MSDVLSKIFGVVLSFILLAFAPLTINALSNDLTMKRASLNEVSNFINKVSDTGTLTDTELKDFYLGCASHGAVADVKITHYLKVTNPKSGGGTYTSYIISQDILTWNQGDAIQVTFKAIDYSGAQRILWQLLKLSQPKFEFTLAGRVR